MRGGLWREVVKRMKGGKGRKGEKERKGRRVKENMTGKICCEKREG